MSKMKCVQLVLDILPLVRGARPCSKGGCWKVNPARANPAWLWGSWANPAWAILLGCQIPEAPKRKGTEGGLVLVALNILWNGGWRPYFVASKKLLQETPFWWQHLMGLVNLTFIEFNHRFLTCLSWRRSKSCITSSCLPQMKEKRTKRKSAENENFPGTVQFCLVPDFRGL